MECAHTGTDSKYIFTIFGMGTTNASTGYGLCLYRYLTKVQKCQYQYGHHVGMPVPVMERAHTGTEPMYNQ